MVILIICNCISNCYLRASEKTAVYKGNWDVVAKMEEACKISKILKARKICTPNLVGHLMTEFFEGRNSEGLMQLKFGHTKAKVENLQIS